MWPGWAGSATASGKEQRAHTRTHTYWDGHTRGASIMEWWVIPPPPDTCCRPALSFFSPSVFHFYHLYPSLPFSAPPTVFQVGLHAVVIIHTVFTHRIYSDIWPFLKCRLEN